MRERERELERERETRERGREAIYSYKKLAFLSSVVVELLSVCLSVCLSLSLSRVCVCVCVYTIPSKVKLANWPHTT